MMCVLNVRDIEERRQRANEELEVAEAEFEAKKEAFEQAQKEFDAKKREAERMIGANSLGLLCPDLIEDPRKYMNHESEIVKDYAEKRLVMIETANEMDHANERVEVARKKAKELNLSAIDLVPMIKDVQSDVCLLFLFVFRFCFVCAVPLFVFVVLNFDEVT